MNDILLNDRQYFPIKKRHGMERKQGEGSYRHRCQASIVQPLCSGAVR